MKFFLGMLIHKSMIFIFEHLMISINKTLRNKKLQNLILRQEGILGDVVFLGQQGQYRHVEIHCIATRRQKY